MKYELPFSTADCDESPKIEFVLGRLTLNFDYYSKSGKNYAEIVFEGAISMIFIADPLVTEDMLEAYSSVCEYDSSEWLIRCREKWKYDFSPDFRHYRIYFDHYGCVDVIADNWKLDGVKMGSE